MFASNAGCMNGRAAIFTRLRAGFPFRRRTIFDTVVLESNSGVICAEMMTKIQRNGFRVVEVPVHHYQRALALLRPGGLVAIDNVLWGGAVADETVRDADTAAIRAFNEMVRGDDRVALAMVPIADGLTLARKR